MKTDGFIILIADDKEDICEVLSDYLEGLSFVKNVITAQDGVIAERKMKNQVFDLVVMDLEMPKRDGFTVLKNIISQDRLTNDKILIISGELNLESVKQATRIGVKNILVKPFKKDEFIARIMKILGLEKKKGAA